MTDELAEICLRRIRLGGDTILELKRVALPDVDKIDGPHPDSLADELAAMANAQGGTLIIGVDDTTREVLGIPLAALDRIEQWLAEICRTRIVPPLDIATRHLKLPDADGVLRPVILVAVPRSLRVHRSPGGYMKQVAHVKREMTPDTLARLFQLRSQTHLIHFEEQAVPETCLDDADPLLLRQFIRRTEGGERRQMQRLRLSAQHVGRECLSVLGVLLCTPKPTRWLPSAYIQAVAYRGIVNDPSEQMDAKDLDGPVDRQIWDAYDFVRLYMRTPVRKAPARSEYPQYSLRAVFEGLVNAVAHRDYSIRGGRIRLHLFVDRLELYSPGALPYSMSIDSMIEMSMPRNEILASLFSRYYPVRDPGLEREFLMDRRGSGVDVILRESERLSGKRPRYDSLDDMELRLTLFAAKPPV